MVDALGRGGEMELCAFLVYLRSDQTVTVELHVSLRRVATAFLLHILLIENLLNGTFLIQNIFDCLF